MLQSDAEDVCVDKLTIPSVKPEACVLSYITADVLFYLRAREWGIITLSSDITCFVPD